jgi:hypothetical protein
MTERRKGTKLSPRAAFAAGLTQWLRGHRFNIGLSLEAIDADRERDTIHKLLDLAHVALPAPMLLSKGAGSEELFDALIPFAPRADILASKVDFGTVIVLLVIFADGLTPRSLMGRLEDFLEFAGPLAQFGPRTNFGPQGNVARLYPLLIYFDAAQAVKARKALLPNGWQSFILAHVFLRVGIVSVAEKTVDWAEKTGVAKAGEVVAGYLGLRSEPFLFEADELNSVEMLSDQFATKSVARH